MNINNINKKIKDSYNEDIVFMFYSKSSNKPYPGYGAGEKIEEKYKDDYIKLSKIENWRKKLSNFWLKEFELDGLKWYSVEHYFQANKFKKYNPKFYFQFSLNSNSELSKNPVFARSIGSIKSKIRNKNIMINNDFFNLNNINKILFNAQYAKFSQNKDLKKMLLLTKNAKLMHHSRNSKPVFVKNLIYIRNLLQK